LSPLVRVHEPGPCVSQCLEEIETLVELVRMEVLQVPKLQFHIECGRRTERQPEPRREPGKNLIEGIDINCCDRPLSKAIIGFSLTTALSSAEVAQDEHTHRPASAARTRGLRCGETEFKLQSLRHVMPSSKTQRCV
jgi:hypothetical protein